MNRKQKILNFFENEANFPLMMSETAGILGVPKKDMEEFENIMNELIDEGKLVKTGKKRYSASKKAGVFEGVFIANERGYGFVTVEGFDRDFYISGENTGDAIDGDRVLVKKIKGANSGERSEATILKILKREERIFSGVFKGKGVFGYVKPGDKKLPPEIYISSNDVLATDGDRVVAEINSNNLKECECKICEVLGKEGDIGIDVLTILVNHGIREEFPKNVIAAAKRQPKEVKKEEIAKRVDLRDKIIVTIDGEDAKDLDDAVNVKRLENGNFELGVHIADVGNYVKRGGVIDKEAFNRGTSVYPVDRVVPMLPKELSNGICSLNPEVDRLALSVVMEINSDGAVINRKIFESVIKTKQRMSYTDVTAILNGDKKTRQNYSELVPHFELMAELARILADKRKKRGSIDFDFPESKAVLDKDGKCVDIIMQERGISNGIIEEFMLACNETVAEFMHSLKMPFVYRIHEAPSEEKLRSFSEFASSFGYRIPKNVNKVSPKIFQNVLLECRGKKEEELISTVMLRSMMKANYSSENLGHFGLALKDYCHFTSPIRRYPDLVIHRIIKDYLHKKKINKEQLADFCAEASEKSSKMEIRAQEAERETLDMKKAEFMSNHIGERFCGRVSSVTSFGMFVRLDNTIEGLVTMSELSDDYYEFDEENMRLYGTRKGNVYTLGDVVTVSVLRSDKDSGEIDFSLCSAEKETKINKPFKKSKQNKGKDKNKKVQFDTRRFLKKKSRRGKARNKK